MNSETWEMRATDKHSKAVCYVQLTSEMAGWSYFLAVISWLCNYRPLADSNAENVAQTYVGFSSPLLNDS